MSENSPQFNAFDPEADVEVSARNLPHWFQPGVAVFITMRTLDSMPRDAIELWDRQQRDWLLRQGFHVDAATALPYWKLLPTELQSPYRKMRERLFHWHLDQCHGACHLRNRELAEEVLKSLWHFNGSRYEIDCAIILPNHVHLIAMFYLPTTCRKQCTSWQRFTATEINNRIGEKGYFWQGEPFDHLIRSSEQFVYLRNYIAQNGIAANLPDTDWVFRQRV
jgi:putative transposase